MKKIVVDDKIPFIKGVFEPYGVDVVYKSGGDIGADDVVDADALVVRTRTRCDATMLNGSAVRLVATATIGFDHIDMEYCAAHGVRVSTSSGCNARGVAQYVFGALAALSLAPTKGSGEARTLGVVGVGHVGSVVAEVARNMGYKVLLNDPPRQKAEPSSAFCSLTELALRSDVVTFHTPLDDTTRGLISADFLALLSAEATVINSSRGEVGDEVALLDAIKCGQVASVVLDVWHNEPCVNHELLDAAVITTPHIAGYSLQGKAMGTAMVVRAVAEEFGITELMDWYPSEYVTPTVLNPDITWPQMIKELNRHYHIMDDSLRLKLEPHRFEQFRGQYTYRPEFF